MSTSAHPWAWEMPAARAAALPARRLCLCARNTINRNGPRAAGRDCGRGATPDSIANGALKLTLDGRPCQGHPPAKSAERGGLEPQPSASPITSIGNGVQHLAASHSAPTSMKRSVQPWETRCVNSVTAACRFRSRPMVVPQAAVEGGEREHGQGVLAEGQASSRKQGAPRPGETNVPRLVGRDGSGEGRCARTIRLTLAA